jgi:hypothetical protein
MRKKKTLQQQPKRLGLGGNRYEYQRRVNIGRGGVLSFLKKAQIGGARSDGDMQRYPGS